MAYARILDRHSVEAGTAESRIVFRGPGDTKEQRRPAGLSEESRIRGAPLVDPGGTGCHLRFVGYLEGLLCHCYYPWTVKLLEAEGPVAGFRVSMRSDHRGWHHFYDVSCDYLVFDHLPEVVLIKVTPIVRKGAKVLEPPRVRLNHIGSALPDGGLHAYSHDPDGPFHRDQTTGPDADAYNLMNLPEGDPVRGSMFPGSLNPRGSDLVPTLTRGILSYRRSSAAPDSPGHGPVEGWIFRVRDFAGTYLTPGWYRCLDLDGSRAVCGEESLFALWFTTNESGLGRILDLERAINTPLSVTADLHVDGKPASLVAQNQWHRPKPVVPLVLPPPLTAARPAAGVEASRKTGVYLLRDFQPWERRAVGTLGIRARYRSDREIEITSTCPTAVPVTLVLHDEYSYDGATFDPDQYLRLRDSAGTEVPYRVHLHRVRILVRPGTSVVAHANGSFATYRQSVRSPARRTVRQA